MKRNLFLVSFFLILLCSCNNSPRTNSEQHKTEQQVNSDSYDSSRSYQNDTKKEETPAVDTFTTSKGTYPIDRTLEYFYNLGTSDGSQSKDGYGYQWNGYGTEKQFKNYWLNRVGFPENEKAKDVYNRALQKYMKGYDDGYNF